jgi:acrylyl-CoA reductase (NADPH)
MGFLACRIYSEDKKIKTRLEQMEIDALLKGEVVIRVAYSGVNFKDALAATGQGKIMRRFPLNAGIDLAGVVESSEDGRFSPGDEVLANGCGLGEDHDGGLAQYARIPADWVVPLPAGLSLKDAMIHGTAGFTAALAIHRMLENGQVPDQGPIAVTGASGGVGSIAIAILTKLGYETVAISSRSEYESYLTELGAGRVITADDLGLGGRPLEKAAYGGVIDNVGGELLAKLIAHVNLWGNVASIGMAQDFRLTTTVFPFILRGVNLLGASSMNCPMPLRQQVWTRLGSEFRPASLSSILTREVPLAKVAPIFAQLLDRKLHGRVLVNCA